MLNRLPISDAPRIDPVPVLLSRLQSENDVLRTDAIGALAACAPGDKRAHDALLGALLDPDPDVRTDAMHALCRFAQTEDADTIRTSLQGDPVREVKLAAISILADLKDTASVPMLRRLALSRDEENTAWEDDGADWEDWLDVQKAAIRALGHLNATDAIADILAARDDEFGQNLDVTVFNALADMGSDGVTWLLSIAQTEQGLARKRALEILAKGDAATLRDHLPYLLDDEMADVRRLAIPFLAGDDDRAANLALNDPDATIRRDALARFGPARPDIVKACIADTDDTVQAVALDLLSVPIDDHLASSLIANMRAWLSAASPTLCTAAARNWMRVASDQNTDVLVTLVRDPARPLEARIAAVNALGTLRDATASERLISFLSDPAQQVRTVALTHLAALANDGDSAAEHSLALAIEGVLIAPDKAVITRNEEPEARDAAAPKTDSTDAPRLRISPEGDIIPTDAKDAAPEGMSTLEAIQLSRAAPSDDQDEPGDTTGSKHRKRQSVEGPDRVASDLTRVALGITGDVTGSAIDTALETASQSPEDMHRLQAYRALQVRAGRIGLTDTMRTQIEFGTQDRLPAIRAICAEICVKDAALNADLEALLGDEDALVRAIVIRQLEDAETACSYLADSARAVRLAALDRLFKGADDVNYMGIFDTLLAAERIDTFSEAVTASPVIQDLALDHLSDAELPSIKAHVLLLALAQTRPDNGVTS